MTTAIHLYDHYTVAISTDAISSPMFCKCNKSTTVVYGEMVNRIKPVEIENTVFFECSYNNGTRTGEYNRCRTRPGNCVSNTHSLAEYIQRWIYFRLSELVDYWKNKRFYTLKKNPAFLTFVPSTSRLLRYYCRTVHTQTSHGYRN